MSDSETKTVKERLPEILAAHALFLKDSGDGSLADLRWADLREADLREANLRGADLRGANLRWADLREANLREADLRGANLRGANLRGANLRWANLCRANLREANLRGADLRWADLHEANLHGADLRGADLRGANLRGATGWIPLSETDHGYLVGASWHGDHWQIQAGCRNFTVAEARAHWGAADYHIPVSGSRIVHMLDWLEKQPEPAKDEDKS